MNNNHSEEQLEGREEPGVLQNTSGVMTSSPPALLRTGNRINSLLPFIYTPLVFPSSEESYDMIDIEEAIPPDHQSPDRHIPPGSDYPHFLEDFVYAVLDRMVQAGGSVVNRTEFELAYYGELLARCPPSHPNRSTLSEDLAHAIRIRFRRTGQAENLEQAIAYHRQKLSFHPIGHPDRSRSLNNLANSIQSRFERTGQAKDLEDAIAYHHQSLDLCPSGHPHRSSSLNNLANSILSRFEQTGRAEDLEEAIAYHRQSLGLHPHGHPHRSQSLNNLANSIIIRVEQTGQAEDLEEAIAYYWESLDLCPTGHPHRSTSLNNLASSIQIRFEQTSHAEDLEQAITCYQESLSLHPPGHPRRSSLLNNLANSILSRFEQAGQARDLEVSIAFYRKSLDLRPPNHPDRASSLNNLATAILMRFQRAGKTKDLNDAAKYLSHAETSLPTNHPLHAKIWSQLAMISLERHKLDPSNKHLSTAFTLYERSVNHHTASLMTRFFVALEWASVARHHKHESTLLAYSTSFTLFDRCVVASTTVERKFLASAAARSLAVDAASSAIEAGKPETAIEFLERGRTIILSAMQKLRHPLDELGAVDPGLAHEFGTLSTQLERLAMASESERTNGGSRVISEVQQRRERVLSEKWEEVIDRIRKVKGFSNFLQAKSFATLRTAAAGGPVIVVNISQYRSDAIILRDAEPPIIVPLPEASPGRLAPLSSKLSDPRASSKERFSKDLYPILRALWDIIVGPVTDQLAALGVTRNTRIWWCPTSHSCALPLHAAGPYQMGKKSLPDLYISSYTSTLSALIAARSGIIPRTTAPSLLVIGGVDQPDSFYPNVEAELCRVASFGDFVNILSGEAANRDNVISGLQQHSWVHLSCHSNRHSIPFYSSLYLHAGNPLRLVDLLEVRLPNAELAFLSTCNTAAVDTNGAPDEIIHIAGALQFCGFRSVVGAMWAVADTDGPDVAGDFYQYMFRKTADAADFRDSARALNVATRKMRRRKDMTLGRWVNFVHIGA